MSSVKIDCSYIQKERESTSCQILHVGSRMAWISEISRSDSRPMKGREPSLRRFIVEIHFYLRDFRESTLTAW